jgi:REP element-mobilizing transposase RayT
MTVLAYCFMPDHAHLLPEGRDDTNLIDFMKLFKQLSGYRFKQRTSKPLWQKGYYDRVVRLEEDLEDYALYIFANPVRAGLVSDARMHGFSGGSYFELMLGGRPEGRPYGWIAR